MARETWAIDGFAITDGYLRDVEYRDGTNGIPTARSAGPQVAGRHGELPGTRLKYGPGSFTLRTWLGAPAGGSRVDVEAAWDELVKAVGPVHRLVTVTRGMASGEIRTCQARLSSPPSPVHEGQLLMRADFEFTVPGAFWKSTATYSDATAAGAGLPKDLLLTSKIGSTGPMGDLIYTVHGPITSPSVLLTSDPAVADFFYYGVILGGGDELVVDTGAWTVKLNGAEIDYDGFAYNGDLFLEVPQAKPGITPAVRLAGNGGSGAGTKLTVAGPRTFLC